MEIELQFTPTRTAKSGLKEAVESEFVLAYLFPTRWTVPFGEDHELLDGIRWAEPSLVVRLLDADRTVVEIASDVAGSLGTALAGVRRTSPELPFGVHIVARDRDVRLAVRVWDSTDEVRAACEALPNLQPETGVYGWDASVHMWIEI